jgi:hypothetical protein
MCPTLNMKKDNVSNTLCLKQKGSMWHALLCTRPDVEPALNATSSY